VGNQINETRVTHLVVFYFAIREIPEIPLYCIIIFAIRETVIEGKKSRKKSKQTRIPRARGGQSLKIIKRKRLTFEMRRPHTVCHPVGASRVPVSYRVLFLFRLAIHPKLHFRKVSLLLWKQ